MRNTIYFAGTMVQNTPNSPKEFEFIHRSDNHLPYLTKSLEGLKSTAHHANLYVLSEDLTRATLVDVRIEMHTPKKVVLTNTQREKFKSAVELGVFYS